MAEAVAWEIVRRAAQGDRDARRTLVDATLDGLWTLALRLTRRAEDADDIVQETYARTLAALPGMTTAGRFEAYLARVATNLVIERWRRRRPALDVDELDLPDEALEPWQSVAMREDQQRRLAAIWSAAGRLDPQPRAALLLYHAQGESYETIAEMLEAPIGTVKTWLHRARRQVRLDAEGLLGDEPDDTGDSCEDVS
jgi:RNA polymerase sigma-70 factor, ECF subfamily